MKIAVAGGGIFGITVAVQLAQQGYDVELFECNRDLLMAASGVNQFRLHRGYHYPRSPETAQSCKRSEASFVHEYPEAIIDDVEHYYGIAAQGSFVAWEEYLAFCDAQGLDYTVCWPAVVRRDVLSGCVRVTERLIDLEALRRVCWARLRRLEVPVHLQTDVHDSFLDVYDLIVACTYSTLNTLLARWPQQQTEYQFELCEKPVVRLPKAFHGQSVVIMDGPFMCLDPFGRTGLFVMGNVVHAIHQTNVGKVPVIDESYRPLLNAGIVTKPPVTRFRHMIESAAHFMPQVVDAEHVGSLFTIRTVLPGKEDTDERPTMINQIGDRIITIFSGKIGTCVEAARQVVRLIKESQIPSEVSES